MNLPDINSCEAEPIRFPGTVQPHGVLLVLRDGSAIVSAVSQSVSALMGIAPEQMLGQPLSNYLGDAAVSEIISVAGEGRQRLVRLVYAGREWVARGHASTTHAVLIDIEPVDGEVTQLLELGYRCRQCLDDIQALGDIDQMALSAAQSIRAMTGLDRVMIYRFDEAWNGEVIAESCIDGIEPFLGLHFPVSDIPKQARELYLANKLRQIPDVLYVPSGLVGESDCQGIDLGQSSLRSVSPLHIQYLKNMEVRATLAGSLLVEGRLWGLISCHHTSGPKHFGLEQRNLLGGLFDALAAQIEIRLLKQRREREADLTQRRHRLVEEIRAVNFKRLIEQGRNTDILNVVGADGFALVVNDAIYTTGVTPIKPRILELLQRRRACARNQALFATSALNQDLGLEETADGVGGALFVSVPNMPSMMMIWFREERHYSVSWGGDPYHPHLVDEAGRLSPRTSFSLFLQAIRGQSLAWTPEELESANELGALIEIEALRDREVFSQTIFNSNPEHMAVLDSNGYIVAVNLAWQQFARQNGAPAVAMNSVGLNYREICRSAAGGPGAEEAIAAWQGIEEVLTGNRMSFSLDYPCQTPSELRWFKMSVFPMNDPGEGVVVSHGDITERKKFEFAEARLRGMFSAMSEGVVVQDKAGRIVDANIAAEQILTLSREQILGRQSVDPQWHALHEDGTPFPGDQHPAMVTLRTGQSLREQIMGVYAPEKGLRWISINSAPVFSADTLTPVLAVATFIDITERRETLANLHESEVLFRLAFDQSFSGMVLTYLNGNVFKVNEAYCTMFGYAADDVLGRRLGQRALQKTVADEEIELFGQIAAGRISSFTLQQEQKHQDGRVCLVQNSVSVVCGSNKEPMYCLVHVENLTEYRRRQLEALAKQTLKTQEDERTHLSRELHDEIGQSLTALKLQLQRVQRNCSVGQMSECLREANEATEVLMSTVRRIAYRLRPSQLDELGLMSSLRWHLDRVVRPTGLSVVLEGNVAGDRFAADLELYCFRVAQEALTNVIKHAQAARVVVSLNQRDGQLILSVRDNGVGFEATENFKLSGNEFSLGLIGIRERVAALGGLLEVSSVPAEGTEVVARFPLVSI